MSDQPNSPVVYVLAGPNGAGKTTFATHFLPEAVNCRNFLNADLIAAGLSPFAPETQNFRAGRLVLERIRELAAQRQDFGFETTLAGRSYAARLRSLRDSGYRIELFFLWLPSPELAVSRVAGRVRQGGHNIPEADIRRRFALGLRNFFRLYGSIANDWYLYNATDLPPKPIAISRHGQLTVLQPDAYNRIQAQIRDSQ